MTLYKAPLGFIRFAYHTTGVNAPDGTVVSLTMLFGGEAQRALVAREVRSVIVIHGIANSYYDVVNNQPLLQ